MKKISLIFLVLFLSGCISLKIKSESPKITKYDLNAQTPNSKQCEQWENFALMGASSIPTYDTKDILTRTDLGQIEPLDQKQWIELPKNMLADLLIQEGMKHCILFSVRPFGTNTPQKMLKFNITAFYIAQGENPQAKLVLNYGFLKSGKRIQGILSEQEDVKNNDSIEAMQNVSKKVINNLIEILKDKK